MFKLWSWVTFYPTSGAHRLCVLENSHDHVKLMGRAKKKVTTGVTEDDPPTVEDQSLKKDAPQDPSSSKASKAEEQSNGDGDPDLPSGRGNYVVTENDTPIRLQIQRSNPAILAP